MHDKYNACDIFIDQLLAGWYGTAAIEAMAFVRPTICFFRTEYFKYIDFGERISIINAEPNNIYYVLKSLINEKNILLEIGKKSRNFVKKFHDLDSISKNLIKIYNEL